MKKLLILLLSAVVVLVSCTKDKTVAKPDEVLTAKVEFSVATQDNMSHYIVEISVDGREWQDAGMVMASDKASDNYTINIDVTRFLGESKTIYVRTKGIDRDGHIDYTNVAVLRK